jgi:hypothetical protein
MTIKFNNLSLVTADDKLMLTMYLFLNTAASADLWKRDIEENLLIEPQCWFPVNMTPSIHFINF